jgi:hypothetical protein
MKKQSLSALVLAIFCGFQLSAQNVGIGEPNPSSKLSVKGNMAIGSTFSNLQAPAGGMIVEGTLGLGTATPDVNTILDMGNAGKGVVMPKLTKAQREALPNPTKGLLVFDADSNTIFFHNGTNWLNFPAIDQLHNTITNVTGANGTSLLGGVLGGGGVTGATGPTGEGYGSTSSTLATIGTGTKIITTQTGEAWQVDDRVRISNSGSNYMEGTVTAYVAGVLTVNVTRVVGSGTFSSWRVSIVGDPGATGATGPTGPAGANGAAGATGPTGPAGAAGAAGAAGTNGATWYSGSGVPASGTGSVNDFYINTANGAYYKKTGASVWTQQGTFAGVAGATGATGATGAAGANGATGPTGAAGSNGLNGATGATGPAGVAGATGPTGVAGTAGANGATWYSGSGAPATGTGIVNDFYIDASNGTFYKKTGATVWTSQGSLKGATGSTGVAGANGITGATGPTGAAGVGINGATGPTGPAGINGATGATGPAGTNGTNGVTGATGPTGAAGVGINGATGPTGPAGSVGATGPAGAAGANGSTWLTASGVPASGTGVLNDFYLNSSNGTYYKKTSATVWTSQGSLKGATGATGVTGANGATGATGAAGTNGVTGATGPTGPAGVGINGATGPTGPTGIAGPTGPAGSGGWSLSGNSAGPNDFVGTTNARPLTLKVNSSEAGYLGESDMSIFFGLSTQHNSGNYNIGIGHSVSIYGSAANCIAIGKSAAVQTGSGSTNNIALGTSSNINGASSTAIGYSSQVQSSNGTAIGTSSYVSSNYGVAMGYSAQVQGTSGISIGKSAYTNVTDGIAVGTSAQAQGAQAIAIGLSAYASGTSSIAIGGGASNTQAQGTYSISLGYYAYSSAQDAIAIGDHAQAQGTNNIALGTNLYNGNANTVAIGNSSVTSINFSGATSTSNALTVGTNSTNGNGAYLTKGGTWTNASDRNLKEDFSALDPATVLAKVSSLDITKWKYKGTNEYHIGPMAQDFYALFNVGEDNKRISSIDPSGVALAAIKALNTKVDEQQQLIEKLLIELNALKSK